MFQRLGGSFLLHGLAERREKYLRVRVVLRDFNIGDGDQVYARILEFKPDDLRQLALDLVGDAPSAGKIFRHVIPDLQPAADRRPGRSSGTALQGPRDFDDLEGFQLVAFLDVVEVLEGQAAFKPGLDFARIVLETFQRIKLAFVDHDVVAKQPYF
jgi:hypothetical protein